MNNTSRTVKFYYYCCNTEILIHLQWRQGLKYNHKVWIFHIVILGILSHHYQLSSRRKSSTQRNVLHLHKASDLHFIQVRWSSLSRSQQHRHKDGYDKECKDCSYYSASYSYWWWLLKWNIWNAMQLELLFSSIIETLKFWKQKYGWLAAGFCRF